ncbi:MAG: HEAT repeat domain-containing protein, partial [Bacteroidia bacterium]|nr:HEAT repeat domain-containing protein [Bacteroidia bacterium]
MKIKNILLTVLSLLLISSSSFTQDKRTLETKIADLLAQLPANDLQYTNKLMDDMYALGEEGLKKICDQIIPAGTGDDTRPRFAVETLSRYLSQKGKENEKAVWEKLCISYAALQKDPGVKDFFIKQLQLIGGEQTAEAMKSFLSDKDICNSAVAALTSVGGRSAEKILAESLKEKDLPCAAAVMNALAGMKSKAAVNEYIAWITTADVSTKASAYNALAQSGDPLAYNVLLNAAKSCSYRWESTGATSALLNYAKNIAQNGDIKTMDKICKLLIRNCNDKLTMQNKSAALETYVSFHGIKAFPQILKAARHSDSRYRNAAINMSASIPGNEVAKKWIAFFPKAIPEAKPEILRMLGNSGNEEAEVLAESALAYHDGTVRQAAAEAIAKISGKKVATSLISYITKHPDAADQEAAVNAFKSIAGNEEVILLYPALDYCTSSSGKKSIIELMAWKKMHPQLKMVMPYTSYTDESVRSAAYKALAAFAQPEDQGDFIKLLADTENPEYTASIQEALASAAGKINDPEKRSAEILKALGNQNLKAKLIPVLSKTGGREALNAVLKEFENGNPEMRETCFKALSSWTNYSASSALYEICTSGNKTYEAPSFEGYVQQIRNAPISDEEKLLLFRKIMPFAKSAEQKNEILNESGKLKTYQSLFFVAEYIDNPTTSAVAARSAMNIA